MSGEATEERGAPSSAQRLMREAATAGICMLIGVVVMPCVIFAVGRGSLGPYQHGGAFALWRDFLAGLLRGSQAFWFVACAPYLLLWLLRAGRRAWRAEDAGELT